MSTSKRKFSDYTSGADGRGPSDSRQYAKKRTKSRHGKGGDQDMKNLNQLKKRTRNIERLFKKAENLPANKRVDLERELAHYKQKIVEAEDEKKTKKMITKYHMVRFFERKKADRLAKQIQKRIEQSEDAEEVRQLKKDHHVAEVDSAYAKFFPYREPYVSLYPVAAEGQSGQDGEKADSASSAAKALRAERPPLWAEIEKATKKGLPALIKIRDRRSSGEASKQKAPGASSTDPAAGPVSKNSKKAKRVADVPEPEDSGNESDGGFFEAADD